MKKKMLKLAAVALLLTGGLACQKETEDDKDSGKAGIIPVSIAQIVDVFELKYAETKECVYDGQTFKLSVVDIEDNTLPCELMDFSGDPESYDKVKIHVYLEIKTNTGVTKSKVISCPCSGYYYKNDGTDIQNLWDLFELWQSSPAQKEGSPYFKQEFANFGDGDIIKNTSFSIHLGKWYPWDDKNKKDKKMYKFIFIITKNNKENENK